MERLTNKIAEALKEKNWEYDLSQSDGLNLFELGLKVGGGTPIHVRIRIIDREETFYGYEIICKKDERIPSKHIPDGIILANKFNKDNLNVGCLVEEDGSILFITSRGVIEDLNKDDLSFDIMESARSCDLNTAKMVESAIASNEIDMTHTLSFNIINIRKWND